MCPLELSLRLALEAAASGATEFMHGNYSSTGKASASLCLAAYSRENPPLMHGALGSSTVSHKHRGKSEGREHVTEGQEKRERRKKRQHMELAGSHRAYQTETASRDRDITRTNMNQNP